MVKKVLETIPTLPIILAVAIGLVGFLSKDWFSRMSATAQELQRHETEDMANWTMAAQKDQVHDERFLMVSKRLDSIDGKLDQLINRELDSGQRSRVR